MKVLYILFPVSGFGWEPRAAGQCQGSDLCLKSTDKEQILTFCATLSSSEYTMFDVWLKTLCSCFWPFVRPKKSSSYCSSSCMASKRMLMVSTSTRGSRILERSLLAPPGVLVWLSTPKRLCSLLYTGKQRQTEYLCDSTSITQRVCCHGLAASPVISVVNHQLQVRGRCRVNHCRLFAPFKAHFEWLGSVDRVLDEL